MSGLGERLFSILSSVDTTHIRTSTSKCTRTSMGASQSTSHAGTPAGGALPDRAAELDAALTSSVDAAAIRSLFPIQKAALQCTLRCFDSSKGPAELQACSQKCEAPVVAASAAFSGALSAFQARLGRCARGCQDAAAGRLGPQPSESELGAAQAAMGECVAGCAVAHRRELPTLQARMEADAGQAAKAATQ